MAPFGTNGINAMLDWLGDNAPADKITHMSLHTADPGDAGASEYAGASYARQAVAFDAAAAKSMDASNQPVFDVDGGDTITHIGLWTAVSAGTFLAGDDLPSSESFGSDGTLTITSTNLSLS